MVAKEKYMPLGMIIFGDKSHTDLHGSLSVTPITFTATFFNQQVRNNPAFWKPMAYLPNLAYGKGHGLTPTEKLQDEHNCLAYALKSLVDLSESGGIRTTVMGREVHLKPFVLYFIGDTEGHNKWLGHYNSSTNVKRPYRDCHCTFGELDSTNPQCTWTTANEYCRAVQLTTHNKKEGMKLFKSMSRHCLTNALFQPNLPLWDTKHGANRMQPPEMLHTSYSGLITYMFESLQGLLPGGKIKDELDSQHVRISNIIRRQSERDLPRGSIRSGLVDSTRCQSSERKGNFFFLMCIAHTAEGELILKDGLKFTETHWLKWKEFLKLYLAMEAWFHDSVDKDEVHKSMPAISLVLKALQLYFPRQDGNGYKIPKMHGMAKMQKYVMLYGSAMNFYGGPGEASHKGFVKAPGLKTQRRMCEFATQTAGQYYNMMMVDQATKYMGDQSAQDVDNEYIDGNRYGHDIAQYSVRGRYSIKVSRADMARMIADNNDKHANPYGLHPDLLRVLHRDHHHGEDDDDVITFVGFTRATVIDDDGVKIGFNAMPNCYGEPWYDWGLVYFEIEEDDGSSRAEYYPSKILGFIQVGDDDEVEAVVQCSAESLDWSTVEENFIVDFHLGTDHRTSFVTIPMSAIVHPLCIIPDYGSGDDNRYMVVLPKRNWSQYFSRFVNDVC